MKRILLALAALCSLMSLAQSLPQQQVFGRYVISGLQAEDARAWLVHQAVLPEPAEWTLAFEREVPADFTSTSSHAVRQAPLRSRSRCLSEPRCTCTRGAMGGIKRFAPAPLQACDAALWGEDGWRWVRLEDHQGYGPRFWERWAIDAETGVVLQQRDMLLHYTDSVGRALVFRPDPLAKAGVVYGGTYIDDNDQNSGVLDPLRDTVHVGLTYTNGLFSLSNSAAVIQEFDPPVQTVPTQASSDFFYSRSDAGFEMTNALYHLERIKTRLDSLGFGSLMTYAIPVDVNAFSGQDNSAFDRSTTPPRLFFGEGGWDDAEDSDVLAHEYGHALSHAAAPFTVNGTERECLEEALCDYFAMSHSFRLGALALRIHF